MGFGALFICSSSPGAFRVPQKGTFHVVLWFFTPRLLWKCSAFLLPEQSLLPCGGCILLVLNEADLFVNKKLS